MTRTAPRRTPVGSPALLPVPGGSATDAYGAPLCGSPEPLGATYDSELVSNTLLLVVLLLLRLRRRGRRDDVVMRRRDSPDPPRHRPKLE